MSTPPYMPSCHALGQLTFTFGTTLQMMTWLLQIHGDSINSYHGNQALQYYQTVVGFIALLFCE
jgi:hypothetical protein